MAARVYRMLLPRVTSSGTTPSDAAAQEHNDDRDARHMTTAAATKHTRVKTERRRQQCRANQARYRERLRRIMGLSNEIDHLHDEIARLNAQRRALYKTVNTRESAVNVVVAFFQLFRYGINVDGAQTPSMIASAFGSRDDRAMYVLPTEHEQVDFLHATSIPDLRLDDGGSGIEPFVTQHRRFRAFYGDIFLGLECMDTMIYAEETTTIHTALVLELTITRVTIEHVFPHLQHHTAIRDKLVGRRMVCQGRGIHEVNMDGQLAAISWTIDFASALMDLLDMQDVGIVLQQAQIVQDSMLTADERVVPQTIENRDNGVLFIHDGGR